MTTGQTMIYKILHRKQKIEQQRTQLKTGVNSGCSGMVRYSCSTCGTHGVTLVRYRW